MTGPMLQPLHPPASKDAVGASARRSLAATLMGIAAGRFSSLRFGYLPTLIAASS
jgi:hypothetical protein